MQGHRHLNVLVQAMEFHAYKSISIYSSKCNPWNSPARFHLWLKKPNNFLNWLKSSSHFLSLKSSAVKICCCAQQTMCWVAGESFSMLSDPFSMLKAYAMSITILVNVFNATLTVSPYRGLLSTSCCIAAVWWRVYKELQKISFKPTHVSGFLRNEHLCCTTIDAPSPSYLLHYRT